MSHHLADKWAYRRVGWPRDFLELTQLMPEVDASVFLGFHVKCVVIRDEAQASFGCRLQ